MELLTLKILVQYCDEYYDENYAYSEDSYAYGATKLYLEKYDADNEIYYGHLVKKGEYGDYTPNTENKKLKISFKISPEKAENLKKEEARDGLVTITEWGIENTMLIDGSLYRYDSNVFRFEGKGIQAVKLQDVLISTDDIGLYAYFPEGYSFKISKIMNLLTDEQGNLIKNKKAEIEGLSNRIEKNISLIKIHKNKGDEVVTSILYINVSDEGEISLNRVEGKNTSFNQVIKEAFVEVLLGHEKKSLEIIPAIIDGKYVTSVLNYSFKVDLTNKKTQEELLVEQREEERQQKEEERQQKQQEKNKKRERIISTVGTILGVGAAIISGLR